MSPLPTRQQEKIHPGYGGRRKREALDLRRVCPYFVITGQSRQYPEKVAPISEGTRTREGRIDL